MAKNADQLMLRLQALFDKSGMTLDDLGQKMGYTGPVARKAAWQFLNKDHDHRVSMLRRFAEAVGVSVADLFEEGGKKKK
jgi:transcriptional regulator with XRE-family HTH domain